jgi:LPPG:FO 2-phospho-L-lactate transferase
LITALAGGIGAAKFLTGLVKLVKEEELTVVVNTGDDIELYGLHISPDIDIVTYTFAGIVDENKGWGIRGDTFRCLNAIKRLNGEAWFNLGDLDFATHMFRTALLKEGRGLSEVTALISKALGLKVKILPMTDDRVETRILTKEGLVHFEEYLVKNGARDEVLGVEFVGANVAKPAVGVVEAILDSELVIVCPSNPIVSIGAILGVRGVREALKQASGRRVAVSPIVAGYPIKGPADKLLRGLGFEVSAFSVAKLYADFLDLFVIDVADAAEKEKIEDLGIEVKVTNTVMRSLKDKILLAKVILENYPNTS